MSESRALRALEKENKKLEAENEAITKRAEAAESDWQIVEAENKALKEKLAEEYNRGFKAGLNKAAEIVAGDMSNG